MPRSCRDLHAVRNLLQRCLQHPDNVRGPRLNVIGHRIANETLDQVLPPGGRGRLSAWIKAIAEEDDAEFERNDLVSTSSLSARSGASTPNGRAGSGRGSKPSRDGQRKRPIARSLGTGGWTRGDTERHGSRPRSRGAVAPQLGTRVQRRRGQSRSPSVHSMELEVVIEIPRGSRNKYEADHDTA